MNNNYNVEVGKKIHRSRKALKMSMKTLGEKVNLHESTVSRYEKGEIQSLDIEKIKEFADALNVSASYLISWLDISKDTDIESESSDDREREIELHKRWYEKVGKYKWSDEEYDIIISCALFIKDLKDRKDRDQILELYLKVIEQLKK